MVSSSCLNGRKLSTETKILSSSFPSKEAECDQTPTGKDIFCQNGPQWDFENLLDQIMFHSLISVWLIGLNF